MSNCYFLIRRRFASMMRVGLVACLLGVANECTADAQEVEMSFAPSLPYDIGAFAVQEDGRIVVGEFYETFAAFTDMRRFLPDGSIDSTFNHYANALQSRNNGQVARVDSVSCFMDGTVALSGTFDRIDNFYSVNRIAKFDLDGRFLFYPAPLTDALNWVVSPSIASLPDNRAMVWGYFSRVAGIFFRPGAILLNNKGFWLSEFYPNPTTNSTGSSVEIDHRVSCMIQLPDRNFLISGQFDRIGGRDYPYLAKVNALGVVDATFQPNPNGNCFNLALQADGKILVSGSFSEIGGGFRSGIARLNQDGSLDPTFTCQTNSALYSLVVRTDGKILISGDFTTVNGIPRGRVALLNSNGSLNTGFGLNSSANGLIAGVFIQEDGKALLGGSFSQIGGITRLRLGRLTSDVPAVSEVKMDAEGTQLTWLRSGSSQEIQNAEFRLSLDGVNFGRLLGNGQRVTDGWQLENLKLPGNRSFHIQVKGLARGGYLNSSTSVMKSVTPLFRSPPQIVSAPTHQTVVAGTLGVTFSANAASEAMIVYQWKRDGKSIPGGSASSYTIPGGVTSGHAGRYTCTISSSAGSVTTAPALLTVITPIRVTRQPQFQAVLSGKQAVFSVQATGTSPVYKWFKDDVEVTSVAGPVLRIPAAVASQHEGTYRVEVSNLAGAVVSDEVALHVVEVAPTATLPASRVLAVGQTLGAEIQATIVSESPPVVQWLKNGKLEVKAGQQRLNLVPVSLQTAGLYAVRASNPVGSAVSATIDISVIDQTPKQTVARVGSSVNLMVIAKGANLAYRWRKGEETYLSDGVNVSGALSSTLTLANLAAGDAGDYICEVTAAGGTLEAGTQTVFVSQAAPQILVPFSFPPAMLSSDYDFTIPMSPGTELVASNFAARMLPPGLRIDALGRITGRPTKVGLYRVSITPSNPSGIGATVSDLPLEVVEIPRQLVGAFVGFVPGNRSSSLFRQGARLDLLVTPQGTYSGKISFGAASVRLSGGRLNVGVGINGMNTLLIPRRGASPLTLAFSVDTSEETLTGTLTDGVEMGNLSGWRNLWTRASRAAIYQGYYTMALEGDVANVANLDQPYGDGCAAFTVSEVGMVRTTGKLPDGTAFTMAAFVGKSGQLALYAPIYRPTGGLVNGAMTVTTSGVAPTYLGNSVSGDVKWYKFPLFAGVSYAGGFESISLEVNGAKFARTTVGNVLGSNPNAVAPDVIIEFTGARVEQAVGQSPNVSARMNAVSQFVLPAVGSSNSAATSLRLNPATGLFTGSFTLTTKNINNPALANKRTGRISGVIVRNGLAVTGVGRGAFVLSQTPGTSNAVALTGRVSVVVP